MKKKKEFFFIQIPYFLISILPLTLLSGPFLSDASVSIVALIFIIYTFFFKEFKYYKNIYFYSYLGFIFFLIISSFINFKDLKNYDSLIKSVFYFRFGFFALAFWFIIEKRRDVLKNLYWCFLFVFLLLIIDGFYQFYFEENLIGLKKQGSRISSFFGSELVLGSYLVRLLPIFFAITIFFKEKPKIINSMIILIFLEVLIFLSGERSAFFLLNLTTIYFLILSKNLVKIRMITFSLSLILILFISIFNNSAKTRMIDETLSNIGLDNNSKKIYIFSKLHETFYKTSINIFRENPFIGVGVRNYRIVCSDEKYNISELSCSTHPHNTYFELLSETGFIGFGFILTIFIILVYYSLKHLLYKFKKKQLFQDYEIVLMSGILITLWPFIPTGSFFNNWLNCLYYFPVGFFLWSQSKDIKIKD